MKKVLTIVTIMIILLLSGITSNAALEITEEKLEETFNKILQESEDSDGYSFDKEKDMILLKNEDGTEYELMYNLEDKPKFYIDMRFEKTMNKEEADEEIEKSVVPAVGFLLTSDIIGIKQEDSIFYFYSKYFKSIMQNSVNQTIEYTNGIEYAKQWFPETNNILVSDKLFTLRVNKQEETDTEYRLKAELTVITEEDFSELNGYAEKLGQDLSGKFEESLGNWQEELENAIEQEKNLVNNIETVQKENNVVANIQKIPQTGNEISLQNILYSVIVIAVLLGVCIAVYNKKISK